VNVRKIVNFTLCIVLAVIVCMLCQEMLGYKTILCSISDACMMGRHKIGSGIVALLIMLPIVLWGLYESSARRIPTRS